MSQVLTQKEEKVPGENVTGKKPKTSFLFESWQKIFDTNIKDCKTSIDLAEIDY